MVEFRIDRRDLDFVLFEQLRIHELKKYDRYSDFDADD